MDSAEDARSRTLYHRALDILEGRSAGHALLIVRKNGGKASSFAATQASATVPHRHACTRRLAKPACFQSLRAMLQPIPSPSAPSSIGLAGRIVRAYRRAGAGGFAALLLKNLRALLRGELRQHAYVYDTSFDRTYGVDTSGVLEIDEIVGSESLKAGAVRYEATEPDCFRFLMERAGIGSASGLTFVDVGSGKGRVLILAREAGFRKVVGLEMGLNLHHCAQENFARLGLSEGEDGVELVLGDAAAYPLPPEPTVCFMNNPFGPDAMARLLDGMEASLAQAPRPFYLLYHHANHRDAIDARGGWTLLGEGCFKSRAHPFAVYRWGTERRAA